MSLIISDEDRIKWIRYLQCALANVANSTGKAVAFRKRSRECLKNDLILLNNVIRILYKYTSFASQPTYAYSFTFTRSAYTTDTLTLTIGAQTFVKAVTTDTEESIVDYYESVLVPSGTNPDLYSEADDDTLYVWSSSPTLSYSSTSTLTSLNSTTTVTATSMENDLQDILDLWNCLTNEQLCELISVVKDLDEECNC